MLTFNKMYTGASVLAGMAPSVFSLESQNLIQVWGLAYMAVSRDWKKVPMLSLVFFAEKMLYVWWWYLWIREESNRNTALEMVTSGSNPQVGTFFLVYGLNDLLFGLVFLYGGIQGLNQAKTPKQEKSA